MIKVLVVDDDALVRAGLTTILTSAGDIEVVRELGDGVGVLSEAERLSPDVVVMDIRMPRVDGLAATKLLTAVAGAPKVLILTTFHLDEYVFGALEAGASGFLLKDTPPVQMIDAVRVIAAGEAMLSPADTRKVIDRFAGRLTDQRRIQARARLEALSVREVEIARAVERGLSNAEIAREFVLSEATVKAHISHVLTKLGVPNRVQVAILVHDAIDNPDETAQGPS